MAKTGFLLAEDEAMKAKFSNLYVPDPKSDGGGRRVRTWFGMPSAERERTYPFITIDLVDIIFAADRAETLDQIVVDGWPSNASTYADYNALVSPDVVLDPEAPYATAVRWQPYDIYYQVATHTRSAIQDRHLNAQMLSVDYASLSQLSSLHVPEDDTYRWLDNVGWNSADYIDNEGKNVWRKIFNLKISAHQPVTDPNAYVRVLQAAVEIYGMADGEQYGTYTNDPPPEN